MSEDVISYDSSLDQYYVDVSLDGTDNIAETVVYGVAEILESDPLDLPPIGNIVNTDSLERLFYTEQCVESEVSVSFEYAGYVVVVSADGRISFIERD